ncbi:MAG: zinc-dependent alcohol dehydrogenase [Hyphomicrobiaceae bacterium]
MVTRRSAGNFHIARAVWYTQKGTVELRPDRVGQPAPGHVRITMLYSGISRGTERLVFEGGIGVSEYERMRAPFQSGQFSFPVKYGYCATGVIESGADEIVGRTAFCLHPHQDVFVVPATAITLLPEGLPARRATLAANMETALNAIWDSRSTLGDRIVIVGGGIVGLLVAYLAAHIPGTDVTVVDIDSSRKAIVEKLSAKFATPDDINQISPADVVFHTSATANGLQTAISLAGAEATIVEMSWYGDCDTPVNLGGAFHSQRLRLIASQVGQIPAHRQRRWNSQKRIAKALDLLQDPVFDSLVADEIAFDDVATALPEVLSRDAKGLAPVIRYASMENS